MNCEDIYNKVLNLPRGFWVLEAQDQWLRTTRVIWRIESFPFSVSSLLFSWTYSHLTYNNYSSILFCHVVSRQYLQTRFPLFSVQCHYRELPTAGARLAWQSLAFLGMEAMWEHRLEHCHHFHWIVGPQKHRYSHWNCIAILYTSWDVCISSLHATILDFPLPVPLRLVVQHCHYFHRIAGPRKHRYRIALGNSSLSRVQAEI